eukprot:scaffold5772_cov101-Cylindrotheca_fusiformis.AAC.1
MQNCGFPSFRLWCSDGLFQDFDPVDLWSSNSPNQIERAGMINTNNGYSLETCVHVFDLRNI